MRDAFKNWLIEKGHTKRYVPQFYVSCIEMASAWAVRKNYSKVSLWDITDVYGFSVVKIKLNKDKVFKSSDGKNYRAFDKIGLLYMAFLAERIDSSQEGEDSNEKAAAKDAKPVENKPTEIQRERTIAEAVVEVLKQEQPLTIAQVYQEIVAQGLYVFGATNPESVVATTIKRHCQDYDYSRSDQHPNTFKMVGESNGKQLFALLDYKSNNEITGLCWDDVVRNSFFNRLMEQGKKEGTARSYRSAMNWVVANYPNEWEIAQKQSSAISGIELFIKTVSNEDTFISANLTGHNQYSAALNAYKGYLNNVGGIEYEDNRQKPIMVERKRKKINMGIDYNATESQVAIILEVVKTNFENGIRLDGIDLGKLKDALANQVELEFMSEDELRAVLKNRLWEIDKVYYHQDSLLCGIDIDEIKETLFNAFASNYQRIYTCRLREYYGDSIAMVVSPQMLGKIINWQTNGQIRYNEKSGFLSYCRYLDKNADTEIQKALLRVLIVSAGLTKEEIAQELRFYSYDKIYWMLDKTEKIQQKDYSWEWREMFKCGERYYHVETIFFTEFELQKIKEIAFWMREDKELTEQAGIILQVARYLLANYKEVKKDEAAQLVKIAEKLMPDDEIDISSLLKTLLRDNIAGVSGFVEEYGEVAVEKALKYYLCQKGEDDSALEIENKITDDEVRNV